MIVNCDYILSFEKFVFSAMHEFIHAMKSVFVCLRLWRVKNQNGDDGF
jgi:hypothetical protein